ncbi:sorting nexin-1a [Chanos chanos]|uniref:Sorting nexin-1 n=1 Tax=Chanos chanos TaxID=29144 RepID=A0A6J2V646_CHACN|nr:sorting nexin-1-like [Chanos chanos]
MAASSERSPPPFPDSEDQELEPDFDNEDSDEGADIFTGSTMADSKMDPPLPTSTDKLPNDLFSDSTPEPLSDPLSDASNKTESETASKLSPDITEVELASDEPTADLLNEPVGESTDEPNIYSNSASVTALIEEPLDNPTEKEPLDKPTEKEPLDNPPEKEPLDNPTEEVPLDNPTEEVPLDNPTEEVPLDNPTEKVPLDNPTEKEPLDNPTEKEPLDNPTEEEPLDNPTEEEPLDKSTEEPLGTEISKPEEEIVISEPVSAISEPLKSADEEPQKDIVEESHKEVTEEPPSKVQSDTATKPSTDLFGDSPDDDDDLFKEPLGAMAKKPQSSIFSEPQVDIFAEAKGDVVSKPQNEQPKDVPTDIFTEEALIPVINTATKPSVSASSKTNGVHSDEEEQDIFAEATVELSLDSPRKERKKQDVAKPSASAPSISVTPSTSKPQPKTLEELEEEESEDKFELNISVTNPEKVGDGMNAYMAYKVSTQTTMPMFRNKTFTVRRRFSDFLGLYEKLSEKHSQNGYIVPPPPEKSILGMTKVKVGKEDPSSAEFVERRRAALERYLQRVVSHPSLLQDPDVREFLERDELPRAVSTQALSGAGFLKMINKATDAVSKMTIKMNESDIWFEEKLQEVESEDQQLRKLHAMVDSLVNHRKELSVNTAVFAKSVAMLGSSEDNTALSRALSQLAEVEDKIEQLHAEQASNDFFIFAELLADYIRLLGAVRASFDQRMKTWQRWQDAQNMLQRKRETEAKLLWANKPDKLQQAKDEIAEWEAKVTQYERDFERVSATVRKEVIRFEKEKARDFKKNIMKYLESLLRSQQQLIKYWEAFLPEAKAIA